MESCNVVKILSPALSCQLPHPSKSPIRLTTDFLHICHMCYHMQLFFPPGSRELQHETWPLLGWRKFRFSPKAGHWLLLPRKPLMLYLLLQHNKFCNMWGSNSHVYSIMPACYQYFSITSLQRTVKNFWGPDCQSTVYWNHTFCIQAISPNSLEAFSNSDHWFSFICTEWIWRLVLHSPLSRHTFREETLISALWILITSAVDYFLKNLWCHTLQCEF